MEVAVRKRFEKIEGILRDVAERQAAAEVRAERSEARGEERSQRWEERTQRMEVRLDKRMDGIVKLIKLGMKIIIRIEARQEHTDVKLAEVTDKLDALITVVDGIVKRPGHNR